MFFKRLLLLCWLVMIPSLATAFVVDPLLAKVYRDEVQLADWWVSEKLDGVRAIWDGEQLRFRSGRPITAPRWYIEHFPRQPLDGELWMGRGTFEKVSAATRRKQPKDEEWRQIEYRLFELPGADGTFTLRVAQMARLTRQLGIPWLLPVEQKRVKDRAALFHWLDQVVAAGGEGVMLHRANAHYHGGRSSDLLKLKPWQDAEATVVAILPGKGKYQGMMGALLVEDEQGRRFRLGSGFSDRQRQQPPEIGAVVTYKFTGLTKNGLPRFASFLRLRPVDDHYK